MMKTLPRTQFGNPILRVKAKPVPSAFLRSAAFKELVRQMFYTMRKVHGVGLAAPQIGQPVSLAVIGISEKRAADKDAKSLRRVIVNPRIIWRSRDMEVDWEGCLSLSDVRGQVPRSSAIKVRYMDESGKWVTERHTGFAAKVFQHEIDHLNGILYVDRMRDMRTLMTEKEFLKRI